MQLYNTYILKTLTIFSLFVFVGIVFVDVSGSSFLPDNFESDNSAETASTYYLFSTNYQVHNFHDQGDEDWIKFSTKKEFEAVEIKTYEPENNCETVITLFDTDKTTQLNERRSTLSDGINLLSFNPEKDGTYYIRITSKDLSKYGDNTGYRLAVFFPIMPHSGTVDGIVSNSSTGFPVQDVEILIGNNYSAATTEYDGFYFLQCPAGEFTLYASKDGYLDYSTDIKVGEIERVELNISLSLKEADKPMATTLVSPNNTASADPVTFTWNAVANSTWYQLWVNDSTGTPIKKWYTASDAGCESGSTCSVTSSTTLSGSSTWWVLTYNDNGNGDWSDGMAFTVNDDSGSSGPPSAATLISPDSSASNSVTFTWNAVSNSTWYQLWVNDSTGTPIKEWYTAAQANCESGSTCSVTNSTTLTGNSKWWVQTYNDNGNGDWSSGMSFTVGGGDTPSAVTLNYPSGTVSDTTPTYVWNAVSNSTWYQLWVNDSTGTPIKQWYTAAEAGCESGTGACSITPTETLDGDCTWWVRGWNNDGNGAWSSGMSFSVSD